MNKKEMFEIMVNEYREACRDYYETEFGEKLDIQYTLKNIHTGEVINGSVSGRKTDMESRATMITIRRLIVKIFGHDVEDTLKQIRREERRKERKFFLENPQFVCYVTDIR